MIANKLQALRLPTRHFFADALFVAGLALVTFGISRWSQPAAFVFAGIAVAYCGYMVGRD
jgi:hypothetical protein